MMIPLFKSERLTSFVYFMNRSLLFTIPLLRGHLVEKSLYLQCHTEKPCLKQNQTSKRKKCCFMRFTSLTHVYIYSTSLKVLIDINYISILKL